MIVPMIDVVCNTHSSPRSRRLRWRFRTFAAMGQRGGTTTALTVLLLGMLCVCVTGCDGHGPSQSESDLSGAARASHIQSQQLFDIAIDTLNRLPEFNGREMLFQVSDRLDQWLKTQEPLPDWKPDPLLQELPEIYQELPQVRNLDAMTFSRNDAFELQTALWLREIASWARGDTLDELDRAQHLFHWTVRNIQLDDQRRSRRLPDGEPMLATVWDTLLFGHGTPEARARVFIQLCRRERIDAAMVAIDYDNKNEAGGVPGEHRWVPWAVGVLIGGEIYLFDPGLGLPVPDAEGFYFDERGMLAAHPAALSEVAENDGLLRQLDISDEQPYPINADMLQEVAILLDADPSAFSQRLQLVESQLSAENRLVLTYDASAAAERFQREPRVKQVALWGYPFHCMWQRANHGDAIREMMAPEQALFSVTIGGVNPLWRGRQLYFYGSLAGEDSATSFFQRARVPERNMGEISPDPRDQALFQQIKSTASYFLGIIAVEQGNDRVALDFLRGNSLQAALGTRWGPGIIFNVGRALESQGAYEEAINTYRSDVFMPSAQGSLIRARWLEQLTRPRPAEAEEASGNPQDGEAEQSTQPGAADPTDAETDPAERVPGDGGASPGL